LSADTGGIQKMPFMPAFAAPAMDRGVSMTCDSGGCGRW
jgi:hypothetical protein